MKSMTVTTPQDCLSCDLCSETAPGIFGKDSNGKSYVKTQPETLKQRHAVEDASLCCPIEGIQIKTES